MYVQLKFPLESSPERTWRALRSVDVVREIYAPVLDVQPIADFVPVEGEPVSAEKILAPGTLWEPGEIECSVALAGIVPIGTQIIRVRFLTDRSGEVRIFEDSGGATSGPLALLRGWRHRMAIAPIPGEPGRSMWIDRVEFHGPLAPVYWPVMWGMWQMRGLRIRALSAQWQARD